MKNLKRLGLGLVLVLAIIFPLIFPNPTVTTIAIFTLIFAAATTGWNIFSGFTGYVSLGHAAYFGLGGYAMAIMCQDWKVPGGYGAFLLVPLAGLVAAIFAIPLGLIALRVRRHTFVVITIAMFFILQLLSYNLRDITNGSAGLNLPVPIEWGGDFFGFPFYYVALALLIVSVAIAWWVRNSKYGLGLLAIRDDEDRALGLGVKTGPSKLVAFVISALIVGMVGAIWAYFVESIYPASGFDATFDVAVVLMAYLGGLGTLSGPILGAFILEPAQQYFTLEYGANGYYLVIYGTLFLVIMLLLPRGIIPTLNERWVKFQYARLRQQPENASPVAALSTSSVSVEPGGSGSPGSSERKGGINL
ncbi:MAG: branched-chain amino acid ABC transporter permease [Ktedonobacteraceae bacterium]|nr:branched-chain amino acid ABC transporter permease [Ktedonobacteraceae bacterium]